jgi:twitching motility protein PilT
MDLNDLLLLAVKSGATDVHLKFGRPPVCRLDGQLVTVENWNALTAQDLESVLVTVTAVNRQKEADFRATGELDIAYTSNDLTRYRVNGFLQRGAISFAFRVIPREVPTFETLRMPHGVRRLAEEHYGLILCTGATGCGKTTTLASMLGHINRTRRQHIVTIEDPIEILHDDDRCVVNQREVGIDTESFNEALRRALRQDPDVIAIGELRDAESAQTALDAAESGHLVLSTMHTLDAAETITRLIEFFPEMKHRQVRSILAAVLRGVISQRLLPRVDGGRVPAVELMVVTARIADLIRKHRLERIPDAIADGTFFDMQSADSALIDLVLSDAVAPDVAAAAARSHHDFMIALDRAVKGKAAEERFAAGDVSALPTLRS